MKTFATLAFALSLLALAPLAHAQECPGGYYDAEANTCIGGGSTGNTNIGNQTQSTGNTQIGNTTQSTGNTITPPSTNSNNSGSSITLLNPLKAGTDLPTLLDELLQFIIRIGTVVIILMIVYIGFKFVMAQGEPGKISEAREALMWTVVGALILLGAEAIAKAIEATALAL